MPATPLPRLPVQWRMGLLRWGSVLLRYGFVSLCSVVESCTITVCPFCGSLSQDFTAATQHAQADQRIIAPTALTVAEYLGMTHPVRVHHDARVYCLSLASFRRVSCAYHSVSLVCVTLCAAATPSNLKTFKFSEKFWRLRAQLLQFMDAYIYPNEVRRC